MRDEQRDLHSAVWAECPRCLLPFELDASPDGRYHLICPCCGMTKPA